MNKKADKKILVCGGAGFMGSHFIKHLLKKEKNARVLNYDALTYAGDLANLAEVEYDARYFFVKGNIRNKEELIDTIKKFKPTHIINFAAETHVDRSIHGAVDSFAATNINGVLNLLEAVKLCGIKKYLQVSTDEVYGSLDLKTKKLFKEGDSLHPNSPYAATKAAGDLLCGAYYATWGVPVTIVRSSNNYGPHQYPEKLIPFFVLQLLKGKKLPLYGNGQNIRDWIYVIDFCEAVRLCLFKGRVGETYNIGANNEKSNLEIARLILHFFKKDDSFIEFVKDRPGHDLRYAVDTHKIKKELGWSPRCSFGSSFRATINWYITNTGWVKNINKTKDVPNSHLCNQRLNEQQCAG